MNEEKKQEILDKAKEWFRTSVAESHIKRTEKLISAKKFKINPFLVVYLSNFLTGNSEPKSIAKALIYPRVLGTSVVTIFGDAAQKLTSTILDGFGSGVSGVDIEFIDQIDGRKKYFQLKAGPQTINKGDVKSIADDLKSAQRLFRTNNVAIQLDDFGVGVLYGEPSDLSANYKNITKIHNFPVIIGQEFWHRLTGDPDFYFDLIQAVGDVAIEANFTAELDEIIETLSQSDEIIKISESNHD